MAAAAAAVAVVVVALVAQRAIQRRKVRSKSNSSLVDAGRLANESSYSSTWTPLEFCLKVGKIQVKWMGSLVSWCSTECSPSSIQELDSTSPNLSHKYTHSHSVRKSTQVAEAKWRANMRRQHYCVTHSLRRCRLTFNSIANQATATTTIHFSSSMSYRIVSIPFRFS